MGSLPGKQLEGWNRKRHGRMLAAGPADAPAVERAGTGRRAPARNIFPRWPREVNTPSRHLEGLHGFGRAGQGGLSRDRAAGLLGRWTEAGGRAAAAP